MNSKVNMMNTKQQTQRTSMNHSKWFNQISSFLNRTGLLLDHLLNPPPYQWIAWRISSQLPNLLLVIYLIVLNNSPPILIQISKIILLCSPLPVCFSLLRFLFQGKKMIFLRFWNSNPDRSPFRHRMDSSITKIHLTTVILILLLQVVLIVNLIEASRDKYLGLILKHTAT